MRYKIIKMFKNILQKLQNLLAKARESLMVYIFKFQVICNSSFKLNIISFIVITIIIYRFYSVLSFDIGLLSLIISFLISLLFTNFVLNKFEYSKNIYIGFTQRFLIYTFIYILASVLLIYILKMGISNLITTIYCSDDSITSGGEGAKDIVKVTSEMFGNNPDKDNKDEYYNFKIRKDLFDEGLKNIGDASYLALEKIAPNIGIGAAAGSAVSSAIKYSAGMSPLPRLAVVGTTAAITAAGARIGLDIGGVVSKNMNIEKAIKNSPHADPNIDRIPTPPAEPDFFIQSPADITSPLQDLLMYSLALDILILILFIGILVIIFNRYIVKFNLNIINNIIQSLQRNILPALPTAGRERRGVNKYVPNKIINWLNKSVNTSIEYNNKLVLFIFIINSIFIFLFVLLKLFINSELLINIDSYINVHNYIHAKKS
jgi:hypothetical protein